MDNRKLRPSIIIIFCCLIITACAGDRCTDPLGCIEFRPNETIEIAVMRQMTPADIDYSQQILQGCEDALIKPVMIQGFEIQLVIEDTTCLQTDLSAETARLSARPRLVGVIGPACLDGGTFYTQALSNAGLVVISPTYATVSASPGTFRFMYNAEEISSQAVKKMHELFPDSDVYLVVEPRFLFLKTELENALSSHGHKWVSTVFDGGSAAFLHGEVGQSGNPDGVLLFIGDRKAVEECCPTLFTRFKALISLNLDQFIPKREHTLIPGNFLIGFLQPQDSSFSTPTAASSRDALSVLVTAINQSAQRTFDGRLLIQRQKMREILAELQYSGIMGFYDCSQGSLCYQRPLFFGQ